MSTAYKKYKEACLVGQTHASYVQILIDNIKIALVNNGYTPDTINHQFVSSIGNSNIVIRSNNLTGKTATNGVFGAANVVISSVPTGIEFYIILYKDTGNDATSPLIGIIDTAIGLPNPSNGSNVTVSWGVGPNLIFQL